MRRDKTNWFGNKQINFQSNKLLSFFRRLDIFDLPPLSELTQIRLLLGRHERELRAREDAVEASRVEVREAVRDAAILRAKLEAIEGWRDHEILALRTAGRDAVNSLKVNWFNYGK